MQRDRLAWCSCGAFSVSACRLALSECEMRRKSNDASAHTTAPYAILRAELARTSTIWRRHGNAQMTAPALFLRFEMIAQDVITTCSARTGCHELTVWQTIRLGTDSRTDERAGTFNVTFGTRRTGAIRDARVREWVWPIARNCH